MKGTALETSEASSDLTAEFVRIAAPFRIQVWTTQRGTTLLSPP